MLGAGREKKEDTIDSSVGIVFTKKVADKVKKDEVLAYIHANDEEKLKKAKTRLQEIMKISQEVTAKEEIILGIMKG